MRGVAFVSLVLVHCLFALRLAHAQDRETPRDAVRSELLGCYAIYTAGGKLLDSTFYNSSPLVRLDSAIILSTDRDSSPGVYRAALRLNKSASPLYHSRRAADFDAAWWADSLSDSVRISFSDGFSGAQVILGAPRGRADTLLGRIEEHWDAGPAVNQRGAVRALRVSCGRDA